MKLFKPQLQLAKESEKQADGAFRDHYYLHVVTFTDRTNYRTSDEDTVIDQSQLESGGLIQVSLYLYQEPNMVNFKYLTPLVHTVDLGAPVEKGVEFTLKADVFKQLPTRDGGGTSSGSGQTSSGGADEPDRPIGND